MTVLARPPVPDRDPSRAGEDTTAGRSSARWHGLVLLAAAFAGAANWSWRKWGDIVVDYGFELYAPWQIAEGRVLYRDIAWVFGPISQYYHALLFRLFDVSLTTLIVANLVLVGAMTLLVYRLFSRAADPLTATAMGLVILLVFAFSQYGDIGNYNYICPYSNEAVHGLVLSIAGIALLGAWTRAPRARLAAAAGFCLGLVFLAKPELFAAFATVSVGAFLLERGCRSESVVHWHSIGAFLATATAPTLAFAAYFVAAMGLGSGLVATLSAWTAIPATFESASSFYAWCFGVDRPLHNAMRMATHAGVVVSTLAACYVVSWAAGSGHVRRSFAAVVLLGIVLLAGTVDWTQSGRSLPLLTLGILAHYGLAWWRRTATSARQGLVLPILWTLLSAVLLLKMGLNARLWHYGFVLAMPASLGVVHYASWFLPKTLLHTTRIDVPLFRGAVLGILSIGVLSLVMVSDALYRTKTHPLGRGGDTMFTYDPAIDPRGPMFEQVIDWMDRDGRRGATLAALPEGLMLNYLGRHPNSTPHHSLALMAGGGIPESGIVADFAASPPDFIAIVHRDASEFGTRFYGQAPDYGGQMMAWVSRHYRPVLLVGHVPMRDDRFGIQVFERLSSEP